MRNTLTLITLALFCLSSVLTSQQQLVSSVGYDVCYGAEFTKCFAPTFPHRQEYCSYKATQICCKQYQDDCKPQPKPEDEWTVQYAACYTKHFTMCFAKTFPHRQEYCEYKADDECKQYRKKVKAEQVQGFFEKLNSNMKKHNNQVISDSKRAAIRHLLNPR